MSLLTTAGGLVLLIVGAELLIRGASSLARRLLLLVMFTGKRHRLDRWEASLMLLGCAGYVGSLLYLR